MYYKKHKEAIEQEKDADIKNAMCEDVMASLFDIIGASRQFYLTGEDAEFFEQCFQNVKQRAYEEGCVAGHRNCIRDHVYIGEQYRSKDAGAIKKMPDNFRETIMQRFMKRT